MRLVYATIPLRSTGFQVKVFYDREWQEYRVRCYYGGALNPKHDSFHNDQPDACATANYLRQRQEQAQ